MTMSLDEVIEVLRTAPSDHGHAPTVAQVRLLIDDIWQMRPLALTAARPELTVFGELELISIAEHFGKHRARVLKRALDGKRVRHDVLSAGMLVPPSEAEVREARQLMARGAVPGQKASKGVPRFPRRLLHAVELARSDWGVIPDGYDRDSGHGRDVHASLAAVLAQPVDDAEIIRFVDRTYTESTVTLDADHVRLLHWLATHGLASKLLELAGKRVEVRDGREVVVDADAPGNPTLARMMVQAYDLLEVARADAVRALGRVVRGLVTEPADVKAALVVARWLAPGPIGRVVRLAERCEANSGQPRLRQIFDTQVSTFGHSVRTSPDAFVVRDVADLSAAHLTQLLTLSGLTVDDSEEKAAANELRARLVEMGLRNDLDRELPEALRAWRAGRLEEFYASRQARLEGDPDWARLYELEDAAALAV